jgi:hypothetical protein
VQGDGTARSSVIPGGTELLSAAAITSKIEKNAILSDFYSFCASIQAQVIDYLSPDI